MNRGTTDQPLLDAPKFRVVQRRLTTPGGKVLEHTLVIHPGAVVILPVLADGRVVLIRNYRPVAGEQLLELPAGTLEADESLENCAARELQEETGYRAAHIEPLCSFYSSPGILSERMHVFLARGLTHVGQDLDDYEEITVELRAADEVRGWLVDGQITDGKTLAALGYYFLKGPAAFGGAG